MTLKSYTIFNCFPNQAIKGNKLYPVNLHNQYLRKDRILFFNIIQTVKLEKSLLKLLRENEYKTYRKIYKSNKINRLYL